MTQSFLKGDGIPLSLSGNTTYKMVTQKYTGRVIYILFLPDLDILKKYIPAPLKLADEPYAFIKLYELKRRNLNEPFGDPMFSTYNEAVISTIANYNGEEGHYNLFMWVDKDWAMWRAREVLGFPKKLADIHLTKHFHEENLESPDNQFNASVSRYGNKLIEASVELESIETSPNLPRLKYFYNRRRIPSPYENGPVLDQLIRLQVQNSKIGQVYKGKAEFELFDTVDEELTFLKPQEIMGAYYFQVEWELPGYPGEVIHSFE